MSNRDQILQRVRAAVQQGNRPGIGAMPAPRGGIGYQGAGPDAVARFCEMFRAAGGQPTLVANDAGARAGVLDLVRAKAARRVLLGRGPVVDRLDLAGQLRADGVEVATLADLNPDNTRGTFFAADLGITAADYLVAETGSIIQATAAEAPRSLSLLPPVHIVVAGAEQILPDLFDLFDILGTAGADKPLEMPSCVTVITGPSKTGDIELRLVTGVHGPGEVHLFLIHPAGGVCPSRPDLP